MSNRAKSYTEELLEKLSIGDESPDVIVEADENTTYIGFFNPAKRTTELPNLENENIWIIKKIVTTSTTTKTYYAEGDNRNFTQTWTGYATKTYSYKKY